MKVVHGTPYIQYTVELYNVIVIVIEIEIFNNVKSCLFIIVVE
ncbi:MAG: hypothetical protein ACI8RD_006968 [Bacillariaceae sp.]|jgi:hypothetical protein